MPNRETILLRSLSETTWRFYLWVGILAAVVLWGFYAYVQQLRDGLITTGMRDQISWGLYITNFVFFIGISHAGTFISAILRVTQTEWRRPITRLAEAITVFALCVGAPMVIIDLGRPDRLLNLIQYGRIQSPILWDVLSIATYLTGCVLYFYLPLIPDLGLLAAQPELARWRRHLYQALSLGWTNSPAQRRLLERAISIMAIVIIPLAVSVHTVVSWIFAMTLRPGWDSSIFGPYFVVGAIYSGAASVILSMYVVRRIFRLEAYLETLHFRNLGLLLLTFASLYLYFNINEYLTLGYKFRGMEKELLTRLFFGDYAPYFWSVQAVGVFIPLLLLLAVLGVKPCRSFTIPGVALASLLVVAGAWAKRYLIVVPTLGSPYLPLQRLPEEWLHYRPTWVEWSITAAGFAGFLLIYTLVAKLFPIISIWETRGEMSAESESVVLPSTPRWRSISPILTGLILGFFWLQGIPLYAGGGRAPKHPQPTALTIQWQTLRPLEASPPPQEETHPGALEPRRTYFFPDRLFGPLGFWLKPVEQEVFPGIAVTATLRDVRGFPLPFRAVAFSLKSSFGVLRYGGRPTDGTGQAQLLVRDRRFGRYVVEVRYDGDDAYAATRSEVVVDFGPRPPPTLPHEGVLIAPYPTAAIGLPFLLFYGAMWAAFAYAFGYLVLWRMWWRESNRRPR